MKNIKISKIEIENFKGIRRLTLDLNGRSASLYGDNATGKTTVYDALTWLLFGKDSHGNTKFSIKPLDAAGNTTLSVMPTVPARWMLTAQCLPCASSCGKSGKSTAAAQSATRAIPSIIISTMYR